MDDWGDGMSAGCTTTGQHCPCDATPLDDASPLSFLLFFITVKVQVIAHRFFYYTGTQLANFYDYSLQQSVRPPLYFTDVWYFVFQEQLSRASLWQHTRNFATRHGEYHTLIDIRPCRFSVCAHERTRGKSVVSLHSSDL